MTPVEAFDWPGGTAANDSGERDRILAAERLMRQRGGYCPDCDDLCEPWSEDGVTCGCLVPWPGGHLTPPSDPSG